MNVELSPEQIKALEALHRQSRECRVRDRIRCVLLSAQGWSTTMIAQSLLIHVTTVLRHIADYLDEGKLTSENGGSQEHLSSAQSAELTCFLTDNVHVSTASILALVGKRFDVSYKVPGMNKWLHRNGFTYKMPSGIPHKFSEEKQQQFIDKYEALKLTAGDKEPILFMDAVHPTQSTKLSCGWIRKGRRKAIETTGSHTRMNIIGALSLSDIAITVARDYAYINARKVCEFFIAVRQTYPVRQKIHLILDGAPYHRASLVQDWAVVENIEPHYLPPYSPNLNSIELLWKAMNEHARNNRYFAIAKAFREAINGFFRDTMPVIACQLSIRINDNFQKIKPVSSSLLSITVINKLRIFMTENNSCKIKKANQFENINILLSHKDYYGKPKAVEEIIKNKVSNETLLQLSVLSFLSNEEKKFRSWFNLNSTEKNGDFSNDFIYDRIQILECWKLILSSTSTDLLTENSTSSIDSLSMLHELLTHINDYDINEDVESHFVKNTILHSRDDFIFKLYRAHKIFVSGKKISNYVSSFERDSGFSIEAYINVIYAIIIRGWVKRDSEKFRIMKFSEWVIDLRQFSQETGVEIGLLISIMESVSFDLQEGADFSKFTINKPNNYDLFRNKPFLRLSPTEYLPIEGRFVEELTFDNLFHKVHIHSGKSKGFLDDFGAEFELYVQELCKDTCNLESSGLYEYIPEFSYGKSNSKSPDAMILCSRNNTLLALEVKAARYLDVIVTGENQTEAIDKSFNKLKFNPWEQVHKSILRIAYEKRHPKIIEGISCLFISITMNEIPLSFIEPVIKVGDKDISYCFYSLGIHTLELLLSTSTQTHDLTAYDILKNAYKDRGKVSIKTSLLRFFRQQEDLGLLNYMVGKFVANRFEVFLEGSNRSA